jgi:taurine dioxygenase
VSVNSNGGVLHPVVHAHPINGRKSIFLHLGMTGAVLEVVDVVEQTVEGAEGAEGQEGQEGPKKQLRLLEESEMQTLFNRYNDILNKGLTDGYTLAFHYEEGDCVFIDNFAIGHRAAPQAHESTAKQGLRILHRTTGKQHNIYGSL